MEAKRHPEYDLYRRHLRAAEDYRQAIAAELDPKRRVEAAALLDGLLSLLQTYNLILWESFPYCRQCLGGCCVVGATDLRPIDYVALALLGEEIPAVPAYTGGDERACIYLTPSGCSWPARWRPLKCALFYCLGSGAIAVDASDVRYGEITATLEAAIGPSLARLLPEAAAELLPPLPDPVAFADALGEAVVPRLDCLLCEPERAFRPAVKREPDPLAEVMAFIGEATEAAWTVLPAPPPGSDLTVERLLADLETLAWIVEGRPSHAATLLGEMGQRYPLPAGSAVLSLWEQMALAVRRLVNV